MRESEVERYLVQQAKLHGDECRKVKWIGRNGAPDRILLKRNLWVELKAPGKKPEPHQLREHLRMRAMGCSVVVVDSIQSVDDIFRGY